MNTHTDENRAWKSAKHKPIPCEKSMKSEDILFFEVLQDHIIQKMRTEAEAESK